MPQNTITVLILENSISAREVLAQILASDAGIEVVGAAGDGEDAMRLLDELQPHVIVMDIDLPKAGGLQITRRIMESQPVPIIIVSANWRPGQSDTTFGAMEAGALALVEKPRGKNHADYERMARRLVQSVKAMSQVKVVKRHAHLRAKVASENETEKKEKSATWSTPDGSTPDNRKDSARTIKLIAIGASTGGPPVLQSILKMLPLEFPVPILIAQHISEGFVEGMASWLESTTHFPTRLAISGQTPRAGYAYLAPDGFHLAVNAKGDFDLNAGNGEAKPNLMNLRPSAARLFASVAEVFGARAAGVLLTGMGKDGARELKEMRDKGAVTFAQDKETSVVHGMPGEAIALGGASFVLPPDEIARALVSLVGRKCREVGKTARAEKI